APYTSTLPLDPCLTILSLFTHPSPTEISPLSLHDALPILAQALERFAGEFPGEQHDREHREKASDVDPAGRPDEEGQACGQGPRGQAKAAASPWDGS